MRERFQHPLGRKTRYFLKHLQIGTISLEVCLISKIKNDQLLACCCLIAFILNWINKFGKHFDAEFSPDHTHWTDYCLGAPYTVSKFITICRSINHKRFNTSTLGRLNHFYGSLVFVVKTLTRLSVSNHSKAKITSLYFDNN